MNPKNTAVCQVHAIQLIAVARSPVAPSSWRPRRVARHTRPREKPLAM